MDFTGYGFGTEPGHSPLSTVKPGKTYNNPDSADFTSSHLKLPVMDYYVHPQYRINSDNTIDK